MMEVQQAPTMAIALVPIFVLLLGLGLGLSLVVYLAISRKWVAAFAVFVGGGAFCLMLLLLVAGFSYVRVSSPPTYHMRSETQREYLPYAEVEAAIGREEPLRLREIRVPDEAPPAREVTIPSAPGVPGEMTNTASDRPMPVEPQENADGDIGGPGADDEAAAAQETATGPLDPYSRNLRQITEGVKTLLTSVTDDPDQSLRRVIPEGRPEWVEREPYWEGKVQFRSVSSGPFDNPLDCQAALEDQTRRAVDDFIGESLNYLPAKNYVHLDDNFIRDHIHIGSYQEELDISFGEMQQWHAHLQFNDHTQDEIKRQWKVAQRTNRLVYLGAGFAAVLAALSIFYIGLGGQPSPKQGKTGRLRAAVILAILLVGSGAVVLSNWIPLI
jgi:hypothetical protein